MLPASDYDAFADIFHIWTESAPVAELNLPFYVEAYVNTPGVVVELGVGDGRIALEAAARGKRVVGVDSSVEMLRLCRQRAERAGLLAQVTLLQADMRDFTLPAPAQLVTIPWHSIGHLLTTEDKRAALACIYGQLVPGGRLIFDHFIFDIDYARRRHRTAELRAESIHPGSGNDLLLWAANLYDFDQQTARLVVWTDELDQQGVLLRRRYRRVSLSWIAPEQMRELLLQAGFEIEAVYGDFDGSSLSATSPRQIWTARRPA